MINEGIGREGRYKTMAEKGRERERERERERRVGAEREER